MFSSHEISLESSLNVANWPLTHIFQLASELQDSRCSPAVCVHVFWRSGFGGGLKGFDRLHTFKM